MDDLENYYRWIRQPEVSFKHQNIMLVDGRVLNLPDTTSTILSDILDLSTEKINQQIESEYEWAISRDRNAIRPSILIGRLALNGSEEKVLSKEGLEAMKLTRLHTEITMLDREYQLYWKVAARAGYIPEVQTKVFDGEDDQVGGTWLGVRRPERYD